MLSASVTELINDQINKEFAPAWTGTCHSRLYGTQLNPIIENFKKDVLS